MSAPEIWTPELPNKITLLIWPEVGGATVWDIALHTRRCGLCRGIGTVVVLPEADLSDRDPLPPAYPISIPCPACRGADYVTCPDVRRRSNVL